MYAYAANNPIKYKDPDGRKNYLVISCWEGGGDSNQGAMFDIAAETRANDIKNSNEFDAENDTITMKKINSIDELAQLLKDGNIDSLDMYGHGGANFLTIGDGGPKGTPETREWLKADDLTKLNQNAFNKGAKIVLHQCNTANEKQLGRLEKLFGGKTIAESMADYFGVSVTGNLGSATAVPSMSAPVDFNWKYKEGPVYYKAPKGIKTYVR